MRRSMRRQRWTMWMLCCMAGAMAPSPGRAADLPPRPMVERALPLGQHCPIEGAEGKCFTLAEWQAVGHLVIDYRALLAWADRTEVLYAAAQVHTAGAQAVAAVQGGRVDAALAREAQAIQAAQAAQAEAVSAMSRSRRLGTLAAVLGGGIVILGGVVAAIAGAR